ncbi:DNA-3-methyladenine glycosylase II [Cognatiyoonia sediminum]|uniref:DNA-3-methyladenine glycosylase II n=2 Tax=Cognatiyoonia sediminum TaxID=1508389 RepID=A0A1M5LQT0_9RHOB|nr:DNA-3-methyladenine glycosylase II [Cognatiyoonia sediminum]
MGRAMTVGRIIETDACVAEGADWLAAHDPRFAEALDLVGPLPLRRKPDGFSQLLNAIVGQQVSVASANAIWAKLEAAEMYTDAAIRQVDEEHMRSLGLSRQKARYACALANAQIDYDALRDTQTDEVIVILTEVPGIGTWTAEIYAMFSLGRADIFASGDLALQEGARMLFDLDARPTEKQMRAMAQDWSPWQSVAARILWAYYAYMKSREGIR